MENDIKLHINNYIKQNKLEYTNFNVILNKNKTNGEFSTNFCFIYSKRLNLAPEELAKSVIEFLQKNYSNFYEKIAFSKPGYINFYLKNKINFSLIKKILEQKFEFPIYPSNNQKVNFEFVSANPTGKLHLAHAYAAIFGNTLVNVFKKLGYWVEKEFYINDAGNQIDKLALSVLIRYKNLFDKHIELFEDCYHGEEIIECAKSLKQKYNKEFLNIEFNEKGILDQRINEIIKNFSKNYMLLIIKEDLNNIGLNFDLWTSEKDLYLHKDVEKVISDLKKTENTYEKDGALWLNSSKFGDDKDRVLIKNDGSYTYLVPDIALHVNKILRGYDQYYNIWGMDHHGYIPRLKIALQILGYKKLFEIISIQVMKLTKNGEDFKLSKRAGTSLTLQDLVRHIGKDELKWICTSFQTSSHKIVEVEKITKHDSTNPLFYVEYASARINGIFKKNNFIIGTFDNFKEIKNDAVVDIVNGLSLYEKALEQVVQSKETQVLNNYLYQLATKIHEFYNKINIQKLEDYDTKNTILYILYAAWIVLHNGLALIGIEAYEEM